MAVTQSVEPPSKVPIMCNSTDGSNPGRGKRWWEKILAVQICVNLTEVVAPNRQDANILRNDEGITLCLVGQGDA